MRRFVPIALTVLELTRAGGSQPPASMKDAPVPAVADISCGAVVDVAHGNAELLLFDDLARLKKQQKKPVFQPQISVWEPAVWKPGTRLRVTFLDGDVVTRDFVMNVAKEWLVGLNLSMTASSDATAEVRVTFAGNGVWSKIGRTAQSVAVGQPTMGLAGLLTTSDASLRRAYVLHEFGHALGALHEHQRRDAPLTWKRDVVHAYYLNLYGWSGAQVDAQVILPFQHQDVASSPKFDRMSVMMYPVHKEFTEEGFVQSWNSQLTTWDRTIVASLYR